MQDLIRWTAGKCLVRKPYFAGSDEAKPVWLMKPLPPKNKSAMAVISLYCLYVLEIEELVLSKL